MSYFAGGGWRNATPTTTTGSLAQATTTTKNVSASRQASIDDQSGLGERKPLLRSQTDPIAQIVNRNSSQTSLASSTANVDSTAAGAGRRYTFRGIAKALPYFLRSTPATTTVSVASEEVERNVVSASPSLSPSQSVADLQAKKVVPALPVPVKKSSLGQEVVSVPVENEGGSAGHEEEKSVESEVQRGVAERKSTSSSDGSTVVTEEPEPISQPPPEEKADVKESNDITDQTSILPKRIYELERENAEMVSKLKLFEQAALKVKNELIRVHAADLENQRREAEQQQKSFEAQSKESEAEFAREKEALQRDIMERDELLRDKDGQVDSLALVKENLNSEIRKLETNLGEKTELLEDMRIQNSALEETKQVLGQQRAEMEAEVIRVKQTGKKALAELAEDYGRKMVAITEKVQSYHDELSNSAEMVNQLRTSLDTSQRDTSELSRAAKERANEIQSLQQQLSDLQEANQGLEEKVEEQVSQMHSIEATSEKERADLCTKHTLDIDSQRRLVRNLQSSLESLQQDLGVKEDKLVTLTDERDGLRDHIEQLEEQCRKEEERGRGLEGNLAKANSDIRDLEEKAKMSREEANREKTAYTNQTTQLRKQLDGVRKLLSDRGDQIQRLETAKTELANALRRVQTAVNEKDLIIQGLKHKYATLEETKKGLDERVIVLDRSLVEARELAQGELAKAVENHQREMMQATSRIQGLQDELSSFIATAQQLHTSLEASQADTEKAEKTAEERAEEVLNLQRRVFTLQGSIRALEAKNEETRSKLASNEKAAREEKAGILRSHTVEMESQRKSVLGLRETLERNLKQKEDMLGVATTENQALREEILTVKQHIRMNEEAAYSTLRDVTERNKTSIERLEDEKAKAEEDAERLRRRTEELEKELNDRSEEVAKLKETAFQKMGLAMSNAFGGIWSLLGVSNAAVNRSG